MFHGDHVRFNAVASLSLFDCFSWHVCKIWTRIHSQRGSKMPRRYNYSLNFKAKVLKKLQQNGGNVSKTSRDTEVCFLLLLIFTIYSYSINVRIYVWAFIIRSCGPLTRYFTGIKQSIKTGFWNCPRYMSHDLPMFAWPLNFFFEPQKGRICAQGSPNVPHSHFMIFLEFQIVRHAVVPE